MILYTIQIICLLNVNISIATEDLKRKMYSCVLVVGSAMKFQGIGRWLHNRISLQIPYMYRAGKQFTLL